MDYNPQDVEQRWRERWAENSRYEADPEDSRGQADETLDGDDEATFVTVPYPYPSGGMHIGHARTYTVPDVYARYRRQRGDNVLFPIGWHVTGTPIIGAVDRLKKGEEKQLSVLRDTYNVPEATLKDLETPMGFANYFIEEHYKKGMRSLGLSVDWRREFNTNDERYSKFITWQYETLKERGRLEKGLHPVKYCTNERQPVTTHDLLEGEDAEFQEYTLVRFGWQRDGESDTRSRGDAPREVVVPMATLRPETVYGVTNAYIDPEADYVVADVDSGTSETSRTAGSAGDGERWFVSVDAVEKLRLQAHDVEILSEHDGSELVGQRVKNPITGDDVLVLPAGFVDADNATGVVMSVPAHSPDDYVALREAKADEAYLREFGIDPAEVAAIDPISILDIENDEDWGEIPAKHAVESNGIESSDDPALKRATQELYNKEFHAGRLKEMYGEYAGEIVKDVRDRFKRDYADSGAFDVMQEFSEEVVCRCGGEVVVAEQDTWFLTYNDEDWKRMAHEMVEGLDAVPDNTRGEYDHTIDWLNEWPCIRNYGLGTRLPWDDDFVIEPLSDSTIYMAYYTIAHRLRDIPAEDLDREFFDALFYGADAVDGDADRRAVDLREEWMYWYPVDYRFSANDLISNHLTFYLFHHAELFDRPQWPQGIVIMGMGLLEGQKMSSSKGHVVLPGEAIETYGADTVRFFLLNSAEPWQDFDWRADQVSSVRDQLDRFWNRAQDQIEGSEGDRDDLTHVDRWLLSKLQDTVRTVTDSMENAETRSASQAAFYGLEENLRWYRRRTDLDRPGARWTLRHVLEMRLRLLAPFVPFLTNELHAQLTGTPAEDAPWPEVDTEFEGVVVDVEERQVERLTEDIHDIIDVTDADPETIRVYVAADWKDLVFDTVADVGTNVGQVMGEVMQHERLRERGNEVNQLVQDLVDVVRGQDDETIEAMREMDERAIYESAAAFLEHEFGVDIEVYVEGEDDIDDPANRAGKAVPFRPAIHLE